MNILSKINNNNNYQSRYASCSFKESRAPCTDLFSSVFWGAFVWDGEMSHKVSSINDIIMPIEKLNYVWTQLMKSLRDKFLLLRYLFTQGSDQWDITHYFGPGVLGHYLASLSSYKQKHQHDWNTTTWNPKIPKTQHRT